eukprot:1970961-Amphidinium_carterae.1
MPYHSPPLDYFRQAGAVSCGTSAGNSSGPPTFGTSCPIDCTAAQRTDTPARQLCFATCTEKCSRATHTSRSMYVTCYGSNPQVGSHIPPSSAGTGHKHHLKCNEPPNSRALSFNIDTRVAPELGPRWLVGQAKAQGEERT